MLSSVRENLKGTLVIVVIIIFIVPMVISGVGTSFLGSINNTDVASVDGHSISSAELERGIRSRRNQLQQQRRLDASSPQLSDDNLRGPVLEGLTRRLALVVEGEEAGMVVSDADFYSIIKDQEAFHVDGVFNRERYRYVLAQSGFTPANYRLEINRDLIVNQQAQGLQLSAFATDAEYSQLVKLTHQKRSFATIKIPQEKVEDSISIADGDLQAYYEEHQSNYEVPEKVKIEYLDLNVDQLAERVDVSEEEVRQQYTAETANFKTEANFSVAHILVEDSDAEKVAEIKSKLDAGESFAQVAEDFSDDIATNMDGGALGVLTPGMFPEAFEKSVLAMEQGQVSDAVVTDSGTHFIKVVEKTVPEVPTFEARKADIEKGIALAKAQEDFALQLDTLGELTFSSDGLSDAAVALNLEVQESSFFDKLSGSDIAGDARIRNTAFEDEVLLDGHNSKTIELSSGRAVVLRLAERKKAYTKPLDEVKTLIEAGVKEEKTRTALEKIASELVEAATAGTPSAELAEKNEYAHGSFDQVRRSDIAVEREVIASVFSAARPDEGKSTFISQPASDGGYWVIEVSSVVDGTTEDLEAEEKTAFISQISSQAANLEGAVFEAAVFEKSEID